MRNQYKVDLKHALLGYLSYQPSTGYDLVKMFFKPIRPTLTPVYRQLKIMADEGLLDIERMDQIKSLPPRKVYHITPKGQAELKKWLNEPKKPQFSDPFMQAFWHGSQTDRKHMIHNIRVYNRQLNKELDEYVSASRNHIKNGLAGPPSELDKLYWSLFLDWVSGEQKLFADWGNRAIKLISNFNEDENINDAQRDLDFLHSEVQNKKAGNKRRRKDLA